jgi:hypothetical protein
MTGACDRAAQDRRGPHHDQKFSGSSRPAIGGWADKVCVTARIDVKELRAKAIRAGYQFTVSCSPAGGAFFEGY